MIFQHGILSTCIYEIARIGAEHMIKDATMFYRRHETNLILISVK